MNDNKILISANIQVEEIMNKYPETVRYFILNKVNPISCAGAYPKTLGEMLAAKNVKDIDGFIKGLNDFLVKKGVE